MAKAKAKSLTFDACRDAYIATFRPSWRNVKHAAQWNNTLATYASPVIGNVAVRDVDTDMVMQVLRPIWTDRTETANRLRGRVESILDWAKANEHRDGENPARWRGHLENLLPTFSDVLRNVRHHPAIPYSELPAFLIELRKQDAASGLASARIRDPDSYTHRRNGWRGHR